MVCCTQDKDYFGGVHIAYSDCIQLPCVMIKKCSLKGFVQLYFAGVASLEQQCVYLVKFGAGFTYLQTRELVSAEK